MNTTANRFHEVWTDAEAAEAAALEAGKVERGYRRVLALTDEMLSKLEERNLRGQRELDDVLRRDIAKALTELPPGIRGRYPRAETVQEALDGLFLVQEPLLLVLQRMLHWDRLLTSPWGEGELEPEPARRTA
jgi:hypothetical protein